MSAVEPTPIPSSRVAGEDLPMEFGPDRSLARAVEAGVGVLGLLVGVLAVVGLVVIA